MDNCETIIIERHYFSGKIFQRSHYMTTIHVGNGLHNYNGPATQSWYESGKIKSESYCVNGKYHRTDGPAIVQYSKKTGKINYREYWLNNIKYISLKDLKYEVKFGTLK